MTTFQFTMRRPRRGSGGLAAAVVVAVAASATLSISQVARAQVASTLNGPPNQVIPYAPEPGVPSISVPTGTPTPAPSGGTGTGDGGGDGSGDGSGDGTGDAGSTASPLNTMLSQSWGVQAVSDAQALGVNPSALAATCVLESGCTDTTANGSAQGLFQMQPAAFQEGLDTALAAHPDLTSVIVTGPDGVNDPRTAAIAAAGYEMQGANYLESHGVANPTVVDVRGYFNFGPQGGSQLAKAEDSESAAQALFMYTPDQLKANGIVPGETVGQWKASVSAKIGNTAGQPVLT